MTDHLVVITTIGGEEDAEKLARGAVAARVAACAQIVGPIRSLYRWEGEIQDDAEYQVWFKTTAERYPAVEAYLKDAHTYDTPEIIALPIPFGSPEYLGWVTTGTGPRD
jgi:periplasmic divalent cation tolerance protein